MRRSNLLIIAALVGALLVVSCGESGSTEDPATVDGRGDASDGAGSDGFETPVIDPSNMPPPGEARVQVDGETFVFRQADMLEGPFTCEIRDNGVTVNFQSDRHDLLLQGAIAESGVLVISTTVSPEESNKKYMAQSSSGAGAATAESPHISFIGRFDSYPKDDPSNFSDEGTGTIEVTCP